MTPPNSSSLRKSERLKKLVKTDESCNSTPKPDSALPPMKRSPKNRIVLPGFTYVEQNIIVGKFAGVKMVEFDQCQCRKEKSPNCADQNCLNVITYMECKMDCKAFNCQNQRIARDLSYQTRVSSAGQKGLGLFAAEDIQKDGYIGQYLGEYLTKEQHEERQKSTNPDAPTYAFATKNGIIDGRNFGNNLRFLNHSCLPNAVAEQWFVPGRNSNLPRLAIFATKNIAKGQEVCIDYGFDKQHAQLCLCGEGACKGTLNGKAVKDEVDRTAPQTSRKRLRLRSPSTSNRQSQIKSRHSLSTSHQ